MAQNEKSIINQDDKFGFFNSCLFIREAGVCVASDLHIGMEDELRRQGLAPSL